MVVGKRRVTYTAQGQHLQRFCLHGDSEVVEDEPMIHII